MTMTFRRVAVLVVILSLAGEVFAKQAANAARLPVSGTFAAGGQFSGTVIINRFEQRGNDIVAIGFVTGVLSRGNKAIGTAVAGEVTWSVTVRSGGTLAASSSSAASALRIGPAQESCPVLHVAIGPEDVNLLGFEVTLSAVTLDIAGETGTPLGDLVCAVSRLLGNVAAVVDLLNSLLGLLTGLLGGIIPAA